MSDIVQVQITIENVGVSRQGYGMPLYLSHTATFPDRARFYASSSEAKEDFASDSPEVRWCDAVFAQDPKPPTVAIGRADGAIPTMRYSIKATTPKSSRVHAIKVKGEGVADQTASYTSGASATAEQIHSGLVTALNAIVAKNFTAAFAPLVYADKVFTAANASEIFTAAAHGLKTGDGPFQVSNAGGGLPTGLAALTDYYVIRIDANTFYLATSLANALAGTNLSITTDGTGTQTISDTVSTVRPSDPFTVTGSAPGEWFSLELATNDVKVGALEIHMNHAAPAGLSDELDAILDEDDSWYQVQSGFGSTAYALILMAWAEQNERTYVFDTNDTDVLNIDVDAGTDMGAEGADAEYTATSGMYHPNPANFAAGRWMGRWLPTDPGQATAALKGVIGGETVKITGTQKNNLKNRRMQTYSQQYGRGYMTEGMVFSTTYRFLDVRRDVHWLVDEVRRKGFETLQGSDKVPYTANGIAKMEGAIRGSVDLAETQGVLTPGTTKVESPLIETVPAVDKSDRVLRNIKFAGTLQGAVHSLIPVQGTISF